MTLHFNKPIKQINDTSVNNEMISFSCSDLKIALQKKGHLHDISKNIVSDLLNISFNDSEQLNTRRIVGTKVAKNWTVGFYYPRNKSIIDLVSSGSVDMGVIGIDQIFERKKRENLLILKKFDDSFFWKMVLATPLNSKISSFSEIKVIATQYPKITQKFLEQLGVKGVDIVSTSGSTEAMAYTKWNGKNIDAVIDICVSGKTMKENGMNVWAPPITTTYPVLIINRESASNPKIRAILADLNVSKSLDFESLTSLF